MPSKKELLAKLFAKKIPRNFKVAELDYLMRKCHCEKDEAGRGSGIRYIHIPSNRKLVFDSPHPGNTLYPYQIKKVRQFILLVSEFGGNDDE